MNRMKQFAALAMLSGILFTGMAIAQDDHREDAHHQTYVKHDEWKKGAKMKDEDWKRGEVVDYKTYHLRQPPRGYEWREVDGNYVLAAVATGVVASVIVASTMH
jgi:Ni/Co efflux regulator RcnB